MRCKATTKLGNRCKNSASKGSLYCGTHATFESNDHLPASSAGPPSTADARQSHETSGQPSVACETPPKKQRVESQRPVDKPVVDVQDDDPFRAIAEAMAAAAEELGNDGDVTETNAGAEMAERSPRGMLGDAVYSTSYGLSYGVIFPAVLAFGLIPRDSAAGRGLRDGADTAKRSVDNLRKQKDDHS